MTQALPPPPIPAEVDLTDFPFMPLDVRQLRDSKFASMAEGEAFRSGVLLWCAAWHQLPAGSLPDDDVELANLAGYGRAVREWKRIRAGALHNWEKCSDGRLYHRVVVEAATRAWQSKLEQAHRRECDRLRKDNKRRDENGEAKLPIPGFEQWNSERAPAPVRRNSTDVPAEGQRNSGGRPADSVLKGEGREKEREGNRDTPSLRSGSVRATASPETDPTEWEGHRHWVIETLQPVWPSNQVTEADWEIAARTIAGRLTSGETTREQLLQLTTDFAAQQIAKGNRDTQYVENPVRHFDGRGRWRGPFLLPAKPNATPPRPRRRTADEIEADERARAGGQHAGN